MIKTFGNTDHFKLGLIQQRCVSREGSVIKQRPVQKTMDMRSSNFNMNTTRNDFSSTIYKTHYQWNTPKYDV